MKDLFLQSGHFYEHLDGSVVCKKCEKTLEEGCTCWVLIFKSRPKSVVVH